MGQITITLPDDLQEQLELRAKACGESVGHLVEQAIEAEKELARQQIREFFEAARAHAATLPSLTDDEIMEIAIAETHAVREEMMAERRRNGA